MIKAVASPAPELAAALPANGCEPAAEEFTASFEDFLQSDFAEEEVPVIPLEEAVVIAACDETTTEEEVLVEAEPEAEEVDPSVVISCLPMWQNVPALVVPKLEAPSGRLLTAAEVRGGKETLPGEGEVMQSLPPPQTLRADDRAPAHGLDEETTARQPLQIAEPVPLSVPAASEKEIVKLAVPQPETAGGIPVAKEHADMKEATSKRPSKPATAGFAPREMRAVATSEVVASLTSAAPAVPVQERVAETAETAASAPPVNAPAPAPEWSSRFTPAEAGIEAVTQARGSDPASVVRQVEQLIERVRAHAAPEVELRLPLQEGGEVLVKLQLERGEVRALFRTDSEAMRQALEQSWTQFSQRPADGEVRLGAAVFQSPGAQSGADGFQQAPDQRGGQAFAEAPRETDFTPFLRRSGRGSAGLAPSSTTAPASGLQIYA